MDLLGRRREALSMKQPVRAEIADPPASAIVIPLVAGSDVVGVLEIVAEPGEIESRWALLDCLASLGAMAVRSARAAAAPKARVASRGETDETRASATTPGAAWMAHEIRTPLIVARATLERVISSDLADGERELVNRSHAHLDQLLGSVDRILDWACGGLVAGRHPIDLAEIARSAVTTACPDGGRERVRVSTPNHLRIIGDATRLSIAIANLIRNAVRYSPAGTPVALTLERSGTWASLRVDDDGPGVPEDERELIFAPLVRGRAGRGDDSGRGLGLFMARQAVEELGGRIWVESNGAGSSFRMLVPVPGKGEVESGS